VASALIVEDVHKSFGAGATRVQVLAGASFSMESGEALAIVGPSGSGKSTLLHLIGTLERPDAGRIEIEGSEPHRLPEPELARFRNSSIGFVFQDHHLLPQYTVLENVLVPALAYGGADGALRARAEELIGRVGLSERQHHRPAELSGGERQRAAVARALINTPRLLLCDEPTGSLDRRTAETVGSLLVDLHAQEGTLLIVVTHSLELAGRLPRRLEIGEGRCFEA